MNADILYWVLLLFLPWISVTIDLGLARLVPENIKELKRLNFLMNKNDKSIKDLKEILKLNQENKVSIAVELIYMTSAILISMYVYQLVGNYYGVLSLLLIIVLSELTSVFYNTGNYLTYKIKVYKTMCILIFFTYLRVTNIIGGWSLIGVVVGYLILYVIFYRAVKKWLL